MTAPTIGHNRPPTHIDAAGETVNRLGWFIQSNLIVTHETATEAAKLIDTTRRVLADLDDERRGKVDPLNAQVRDINDEYRPARESIEKLLTTVRQRLTDFTRAEEAKRAAAAAEARRVAEAAEKAAREAEERERQAAIDAEFGQKTDIAAATVEADQTFSTFQRAERTAARAERDTPVRLNTGMGRAVSMRTKETLIVEDYVETLKDMGMTPGVHEAILTAARAFRKINGRLPAGMRAETEKAI